METGKSLRFPTLSRRTLLRLQHWKDSETWRRRAIARSAMKWFTLSQSLSPAVPAGEIERGEPERFIGDALTLVLVVATGRAARFHRHTHVLIEINARTHLIAEVGSEEISDEINSRSGWRQ